MPVQRLFLRLCFLFMGLFSGVTDPLMGSGSADPDGVEVFFRAPAVWHDDVRLWHWPQPEAELGPWPGKGVMQPLSDWPGWYFKKFRVAPKGFVFNDGKGGNQSEDLSYKGSGCYLGDLQRWEPLGTGLCPPGPGPEPEPEPEPEPGKGRFSWANATVYFVIPDRFSNGDPGNDHAYGRELDASGQPIKDFRRRPGTFHGGDFAGMLQKLKEGYFTNLGVTALWISPPYEQIHGYIAGQYYKHYAYHGYYALDYTEVDANLGTAREMKAVVDEAHRQGIRVIMDLVMNHPGFATMRDMDEFGFGDLQPGWKSWYESTPDPEVHWDQYNSYVDTAGSGWENWWGSDWLRTNMRGYDGCQAGVGRTDCVKYLPDFKTESDAAVDLPPLLRRKWQSQGAEKLSLEKEELQTFFNRYGLQATPRNHLIKWLTDWVRDYGFDGFRVDTAKHVEPEAWQALKKYASLAYEEYKSSPDAVLPDDQDLPFWMVGEVFPHGVFRSWYFDYGFDALINFEFQNAPATDLRRLYRDYAEIINGDPGFNVLSYMSSHDTGLSPQRGHKETATALLLLPGAVQIYYGDETGRAPAPVPAGNEAGADVTSRSDMNWGENPGLLDHWQRVARFRRDHPAVGSGRHVELKAAPLTFARLLGQDRVLVVMGVRGETRVYPGSIFAEGTTLRDAYTGATAVVRDGSVVLQAGGVLLLEEVTPAGKK